MGHGNALAAHVDNLDALDAQDQRSRLALRRVLLHSHQNTKDNKQLCDLHLGDAAAHDLAIDRHLADRRIGALSPSGGVWAQNPLFCTGLVNAAEAVLQVAGQAGAVQVPDARFAVAHGSHGYAQQGQTFVAFERMDA